MSQTLMASALALGVTILNPAIVSEVPPRHGAASIGAADSTQVMSGVWQSDADPDGAITINLSAFGSVMVRDDQRFEAVGFLAEGGFLGVTRARGPRPVPEVPGLLRLRRLGDGALAAEFAAGIGSFDRKETWKRAGQFGPPRGNDSLPRPGDYVYVEQLPEPIEKVPPDYPEWARRKGISGTVTVQALVGKDGLIKSTHIVKSIPELDDYAVGCVKRWRFKPAMSGGSPVAVWVAIPVKFTLQ